MEATQSALEVVKQTVYLSDAKIIGILAGEALFINLFLMVVGLVSIIKNFKRK